MRLDLRAEAVEYGRLARQALEAAGGDELAALAERQPAKRGVAVEAVLAELGAWDLDPRGDADELEAAAALCRSAGWWGVAYPVAARVGRTRDVDADGLLVTGDPRPSAPVADLDLRWITVTLDGRRGRATARPTTAPPRKTAFVTELDVEPLDDDGVGDVALGLVLPCWTLLGMLDRAVDLTSTYTRDREQFGQPLASFQGVQFQLTDAEVERAGVEVLAKYALWSLQTGRDDALEDALALRLAAIEAADVVFRVAHQLHGAIGFCDETALSWVSRHSQPVRRLPLGRSATLEALTHRLGTRGLTGLFGDRLAG
jgi:3-oxo-4-pregnene-20-carboxyl-CoA dehydrogenase alpha subunit